MAHRKIYLNHAGTSWPKPECVVEAVRAAMQRSPDEWPSQFDVAHRKIAKFFGVANRDELLLTPGCTSSLATAVSDVNIPDGKRVLTSGWEHHGLMRPLQKLAEQGIQVDQIPIATGSAGEFAGLIDLEWLEEQLAGGDVGLVAITAACNVTGEILPYEEVARITNEYRCTSLLDAAQLVGLHKLDFDRIGASIIAFGGHKGLQAPWGIGGLYVKDGAPMQCVDATCELPQERTAAPERPGYCDVGSVDQFALAGLSAAVDYLENQDPVATLEKARSHIQMLRSRLAAVRGIRFYGGSLDGLPTLAFVIQGESSSKTAQRLASQGMVVGAGLQCAPTAHETLGTSETGVARISVGIGQDEAEIEEAASRIESALGTN